MSSRLDRLKQLKAAQAAQRGSVGGDDASSVGGNVIPGPPPPPRNPDGTLITNQNGIDSYGPAPPPFEPAAPRTSLYVRLPVLLHEAEGSVIGAADPSLVWGVSLWDGPNRLTCDVHTAVSPPREPDTPPRILRLDVLLPNLAQFTLRLEVFKESALNFAIASSKLAVYLFPAPQSRPASTMIPISSKSGQKATSTLLASSSVSLTPYTSSAVNILLLSSEDGRPALLAPFDLTLIHTRMFRPSLSFPSAPCAPLCPLDFLLPGRSEVMITVEGVRGGEGPDASPPLSIVAVLAKGNGEALVGPVSLGAAKWQRGYVYPTPAPSTGPSSRLSSAENTPSRASVGRNRFSSLGSEDGAPGVPSATWVGNWRQCVRLGLPPEATTAAQYLPNSNLHILLTFITAGSGEKSPPIAVGFAYLNIHPESPQALLPDGTHCLKVYRGSPPYLPVGPDGDRLFSPSSCAEAVTGDHCSLPLGAPACGCRPGEASLDVYGATPPHLRLVSPSPPSSPFPPVALPQALLLRVSALSCYEVQDVVVSAVSSPAKAAVPSEAQQIHDMVVSSAGQLLASCSSKDVFIRRKALLTRLSQWFSKLRLDMHRRLKEAGLSGSSAMERLSRPLEVSPATSLAITAHDRACLSAYVSFLRDLCWRVTEDQFCHPTLLALVNEDFWSCVPTALLRQTLCLGNEQLHRRLDGPSSAPVFIKWIAAQSFLLASLSQFAAQYDALYGEQFQVGDGLPKELLAEEFVAEKVVELWAALDSIWHDAALLQPAIADGVYRAILAAVTLLLPICSTLLQGAELADAAQPLFKSMASTAAPQPIPAEVDEASSKATPEAPLSAPPLPTPIQTMKSLAQGSFHHSVAPVSPMVSGTPSHADPKWSALRARIPGLVHPTPSASSSAPAPAPTQTSAVVSIRTPGTEVTSVVSSIMAKRRAILGQSSSGSPLPARPSPAAVPRAPPGPPPPKPKTADVSNRCGEVDLILAAFAAVYRHKDLTTESQVVALLQRRLLPVAIRVLSDCLHGFSHSSVASATGNTLPGIQALMGALLESYFIGTLSPVSQAPTESTYACLDLLIPLVEMCSALSSTPSDKGTQLPYFWRCILGVISIACPPSFRSDITPSTLSSDSSIAAALSHRSDLSHTLTSLLKELRVLVSSVRGFPSAERDSVHTLFQDTSLTLPWLTGRVTGQSTVFAVAAMVLQYLRAVGLGHAASEVSSPKRSQESSAHSLIHVATTAIETCFTLLEEANVGPAPQSYMQPWWPVMSAAVDIISVTAREGSVVSNLIARFMAVFNSNASKQLSALLEDSLDSLMVLPHRAEAGVQKGTQPWMAHLTDNVALLLTVPRLPSQSMVVEESKLQEGGGDVPARVVMHMLLKWLVTAFGDQTQSQTPGGTHTSLVPVFLDPVHAVVLLTFSTYLDASLDGVLAGAEGPAPSRSTLWLRTDMKVMQDACFAIRSHTLIGGPSLAVDDTIPESIRALFRLVLSLNTNASLPLLDALARLYAGTGKVKESRPSLPLLSPFPSEASAPSHADPVTAAYTACAIAVMKQHLWESALTSGPAHTLIGLRSVVDAFAHALSLASRVYEGQLVEALVSSCQTLSHRVQSLRLSSPADASAAQLLIDNLSTTCGEALQGIKGLEALIPLYYAVYFVGPSFGEAERGRWFVYRARDTCGGLEFLAQLGKSFPSATVVSADTPITVGTSDLAVFGGAAGPVEPPPAIPSVPPSPAESVYYGSYTFLGSGVHGVGSQVTLTPTGTGHTLSHYSQTTTAVVTPPSHIYVYPAVPLHPHTSHSHHASQLNTDTTLPGAPTSAPGFRVWACRGVTRYTPLPGTIPGPRPSIQHPISFDGPCISRAFDDSTPVDTLLDTPGESGVVCIDLYTCPEMLQFVGRSATSALDASAAPLSCPWLTRRCAVASVFLRPASLAEACLHWQEWANSVVVNRIRWCYAVTVKSENYSDGAALWPRARRGSLLSDPAPGTFGSSGSGGGGWGGGRRASLLALQRPPRFRQLIRMEGGSADVARAGGVWAALASAVGMESLLAPPKGSDLDTVDIFAGDIPLRIPVLHRRKRPDASSKSVVSGSGESGEGEGAPPQEFIVEDLGDDPAAATAASGAVFGTERVVIGSAAAEAMFAALMDVTHPKLAFPCGLHVIHLLLNDYRDLKVKYMTWKRTQLKRSHIKHTRELTEKGLPPPPEPDFATLIPNVPHWMIVRIKRGSHILTQLIGEATRQHRVMSVMGVRPAVSDVGSAGVGSTEAGLDSSERAAERCTALDSCVNSVIEGFLV